MKYSYEQIKHVVAMLKETDIQSVLKEATHGTERLVLIKGVIEADIKQIKEGNWGGEFFWETKSIGGFGFDENDLKPENKEMVNEYVCSHVERSLLDMLFDHWYFGNIEPLLVGPLEETSDRINNRLSDLNGVLIIVGDEQYMTYTAMYKGGDVIYSAAINIPGGNSRTRNSQFNLLCWHTFNHFFHKNNGFGVNYDPTTDK